MVRKEGILSGSDSDIYWATVAFGSKALFASCFFYILFFNSVHVSLGVSQILGNCEPLEVGAGNQTCVPMCSNHRTSLGLAVVLTALLLGYPTPTFTCLHCSWLNLFPL